MSQKYQLLWPEIVTFPNLLLAYQRAARGKRSKAEVARFEFDLEPNLFQLQEELCGGSYRFAINKGSDPKGKYI